MLTFDINNQRRMKMEQSEHDKAVQVSTHSENEVDNSFEIPAGDMVTLMNYYRHQKRHGKSIFPGDGMTAVETETLADRDGKIEEIWEEFGDVPMDPDTECIESPFLGFPTGTHREEVWEWFDERHSRGVVYLLMGLVIDEVKTKSLLKLEEMCDDCESVICLYNNKGTCRLPFVHEQRPKITEEDGCLDFEIKGFS